MDLISVTADLSEFSYCIVVDCLIVFPFPSLSFQKPLAQPEWLQVMSDSEVEISSDLHWNCVAAGKPRPTIRWLRNGLPLSTQVTHKACCITVPCTSTYKVTLKSFCGFTAT